jgi:acyl carrier protein
MEEKFNIEIENENLKKLIYLNDIIAMIESKIKRA